MPKTSYYNISNEGVTGSLSILDIFPNAESMSKADFLAQGYIQFEVPDDVLTIFPRYKNGVLTIAPPPYWEDLQLGLAKLAISQRLLGESVINVAIQAAFTMVIGAIAFKDYPSLKNSLGRVVDILAYTDSPAISPSEMEELQALLLECGFTTEVWAEMID